jgi:hypothetical protein
MLGVVDSSNLKQYRTIATRANENKNKEKWSAYSTPLLDRIHPVPIARAPSCFPSFVHVREADLMVV